MKCNLCQGQTQLFFQGRHGAYFRCLHCQGISLSPEYFPTPEAEQQRYETHNNNVEDVRYQKFVSPIVKQILADFSPSNQGLDFGCGTGPVISYLLSQSGYSIAQYDPFFCNDRAVFNTTYDFIICCEVIEHFQRPDREFSQLYSLLNSGGKLYCMTDLFTEEIDFKRWSYKEDCTHVFFYHRQSLEWIKKAYRFASLQNQGRLIILEK